jgi:hypothetical protein
MKPQGPRAGLLPADGKLLAPGASLIQGARALQTTRKGFGTFPYQWMFPGANAKNVNQIGSVLVPDIGSNAADIVTYQVSEGMRFSCRGLVVGYEGDDGTFHPGKGDAFFSLVVRTSAGNRNVDFFNFFSVPLGDTDAPFPVIGPLEFDALDTLVWTGLNQAIPTGENNIFFGMICGFEYPLTEALIS